MQRFHDTTKDPLPLQSPQHEIERANLERLTAAYLAGGGEIEEVGYRMSDTPATFTINAERSPVYAHLFTPAATPVEATSVPNTAPAVADRFDQKEAAQIMAAAALGDAPNWIARKLHMTEKRVRQIARDYHITFHKQR